MEIAPANCYKEGCIMALLCGGFVNILVYFNKLMNNF